MTLQEFKESLHSSSPPEASGPLLQALWHDARGDWKAAHALAQSMENVDGARIHAYLHRKEGDLSNAMYWYRRAGVAEYQGSLEEEWDILAGDVLGAHERP